ncbi:MAG: penicillin-binding protein 2, partial [Phycisphaerales bacterium]|nr:penicillin-binding protein 2 [Hyphomonadaceae bacterium]
MRPFNAMAAFAPPRAYAAAEAAPARNRVRALAIGIFAILLLLSGRAVQLAFSGDPLTEPRALSAATALPRGDIVDRNGVLLATTVRAHALTATPARVWDAPAIADALRRMFPDLDRAATIRRLTDTSRRLVYLRRGLTPEQRARVHDLGLAGIGFETEHHRAYPQGALAAHALGFTDVDLNALSGVERGLDAEIRAAGAAGGGAVRLSIDVRMQYALEEELSVAARAAGATGGAAILLDG